MSLDRERVDCFVELQTPVVAPEVGQIIKMILDDAGSTLREKQLAYSLLKVVEAYNLLVQNLQYATVRIEAYEQDITIHKRRPS